jgi:hypothetical protein
MDNSDETYVWIRAIHKMWVFELDFYNSFFGFLLIPLTVLAAAGVLISAFFVDPPGVLVGTVIGCLWVLYLVLNAAAGHLLYTVLKCPVCGHNPTRRKKDGKPMAPRILDRRLERMTECPSCGSAGRAEPERP